MYNAKYLMIHNAMCLNKSLVQYMLAIYTYTYECFIIIKNLMQIYEKKFIEFLIFKFIVNNTFLPDNESHGCLYEDHLVQQFVRHIFFEFHAFDLSSLHINLPYVL